MSERFKVTKTAEEIALVRRYGATEGQSSFPSLSIVFSHFGHHGF